MGIFRNIFWGAKTIARTSFYMGSIYTFLAYYYVQEVKFKLGDS